MLVSGDCRENESVYERGKEEGDQRGEREKRKKRTRCEVTADGGDEKPFSPTAVRSQSRASPFSHAVERSAKRQGPGHCSRHDDLLPFC